MLQKLIGDVLVVSNNDKLLAKFHSGTFSIMDTMKLMSLIRVNDRAPIGYSS